MRRRGATVAGWVLALGLFALSLLAKQNGVVFPLLVLLFELGPARSSWRAPATWLRPLPFAAVVGFFFVWTEVVLGFSDLTQVTSPGRSPAAYLLTMLRLHFFHYLRNFVWPFQIRPQPEITEAGSLFDLGVLAGLAFVVGTIALAWALRRRAPVASWSILAYWVLFVPTSSLRPFYDLAVDYRQYPSLAFLCLAVAIGLAALLPARPAAVAMLALAAYFGVSSFLMNHIWRTEESFWGQSVRYGATALGHMNYARSIQGRDSELAEHHYLEALRRAPDHVYTHINLGILYLGVGRRAEGLAHARRAAEIAPGWAIARHWLGEAYRRTGDLAAARAESRIAADLDPRNLEYQYRAAYDLYEQGELEAMLPYLARVAERDPGYRLTLFLQGFALQQLGRWPEAEARYRRFLELQPDYAQAWFNLAHGLMSAGRCDEAIGGFEEARRLDPRLDRPARDWLAVCRRAPERSEEAVQRAARQPVEPAKAAPNIVLITLESLRPDHVASLEGDRVTSPSLDRLAGEAMVYEDAHSVTSWTLPAHASLFTGLYPSAHQTEMPLGTLDDSYTTLAEVLAARGYQTAAVVSGPYLRAHHNLNQGFEIYDESPSEETNRAAHADVTNPEMEAALLDFLDRRRDPERPFLLFAYFWDPHYDYIPPAPYDSMFVDAECQEVDVADYELGNEVRPGISSAQLRYVRAQYDGEIRWTDAHLERFFKALRRRGLWEDTVVVVTADHGEEFFEHGAKGHKNGLHVESVKVPLLVKYPGSRPRGRDTRLVSLVDLFPTLLELAGAVVPGLHQGRSLLAPRGAAERSIYYELVTTRYSGRQLTHREPWLAVRRGGYKLISRPGRTELYDVRADPGEIRDIAGSETGTVAQLRGQLVEWRQAMHDLARQYREGPQAELDPEMLERLRALGYLD
jgi:arylsulfatase A-like enzyme